MEDIQQICITIGCEGRDDRVGDFYNAISEVVAFFQNNNLISNEEVLADVLELKAKILGES